jgi:uncharacterized protein YkwD
MSRCKVRSGALALVLAGGACQPVSGNLPESAAVSTSANEAGSSKSPAGSDAAAAVADACAIPAGPSRAEQVCHRWRCDGAAAATTAAWSGDPSACDPGTLDEAAGARALSLVNLHRFLAGLAPVRAEPAWTTAAQACALLAHANAQLSHTPPSTWRCWSELGARTSAVSLIANRSAPVAIDAYVEDPGNADTMVHRRWLLNESLTRVAFGSTDHYSCVVVEGAELAKEGLAGAGTADDDPSGAPVPWVAWPPPGPVPLDVFTTEKLDELGWTIQTSSGELDLDHASVVVSTGGVKLPTRLSRLADLHGSQSAIAFVPDGWTTLAGTDYDVKVYASDDSTPKIAFTVTPIACP